jgi:hypothetical protein
MDMEKQKNAIKKTRTKKVNFICHEIDRLSAGKDECHLIAHCSIWLLIFNVPIIKNIAVVAMKLAAITELRNV